MVCKIFDREYNTSELYKICKATKEGVSLKAITETAQTIGLASVSVRISVKELMTHKLCSILHWDQNHFVVLYKVKKGKTFYIADPAKGLVKYNLEEFKKHWVSTQSGGEEKGIAMFLEPTPAFYEKKTDEQPTEERSFKFLFGYIKQYRKYHRYKRNIKIQVQAVYHGLSYHQEKLQKEEEQLKEEDLKLVHEVVNSEEIARIISRWTGIPVSKLNESERAKVLHLDEVLKKQVIGQEEAVEKVCEAILRSKAGIKDPSKPIGSFLFLGPTGVGKTELAKSLAKALFDDENNMVRIDMSEYMEKFSVSRLIGAPPGYVGYDEGGQLTEAVRRKPYCVVLLDEVEKAHPDVFNVLLQVLDDGRITDSLGKTVDFKNTIIIMTSNIGSSYLLEGIESGEIEEATREMVMQDLRNHFRPEFLNRLDEIIMFKPLSKDSISNIVELMLDDIRQRIADRELSLDLSPKAKEYIVESGYDPMYGARPLKRFLQKHVETAVAKLILSQDLHSKDNIYIDMDNDKLVAKVAN